MILIWIAVLFGLGECTGGSAVSGKYGGYKEQLDNVKQVGSYEGKKYEEKVYIDDYKGDDDNKDKDYITYNGDQKYEDKKDGYDNDGKKYDQYQSDLGRYYGESKFEKYDGPRDYILTNKDDRLISGRKYYGKYESDLREYDYEPKCDINQKDCSDGKDCYDKAKDRTAYDTCRSSYGNEDRYYDEQDRYSGDRYRYDADRYGYEKDCYDNTKGRKEYDNCRQYYRKCYDYNRKDYKYSYNEQDWKNDNDCYEDNLVGLGKNDREDQLIRPCALEDWQCIRKYFAQNSKCKPAYGPIPDPLYLRRNTAYIPFANVTVILTRLRVTGLSSIKINDFYVNKDTKNLVIAFDFTKLNLTSPRVYFRYKRTAKESIVLSDYATGEYDSGTFTAVIPRIPHLRLDLAEIHVDIDDPIPIFFPGPKISASTDPDVIAGFARIFSDLPVTSQEFLLLQSQLFTAIYIQENICDFGLKLISI